MTIAPNLDLITLAGFGGVLSSILIAIAIAASNQTGIFSELALGISVHMMFCAGLAGLFVLPIFASYILLNSTVTCTDSFPQWCVWILDVITAISVISLIGYYVLYFRNKSWLQTNAAKVIPPTSENLL